MLKITDEKLLKEVLINSLIDVSKYTKIKDYLVFLLEKNRDLNLVSRKLTTQQIITDHIYDCLLGFKFFHSYNSICDIGSGGGFPGILLAIVFENKEIFLIEKSEKKVSFLKECIKHLKLNNVKVIQGLVQGKEITTDVITCRAFKSILEILEMTSNFFESKKEYILYKGRIEKIEEELKEASVRFKINSRIEKLKEFLDKERHIIIIKKKS